MKVAISPARGAKVLPFIMGKVENNKENKLLLVDVIIIFFLLVCCVNWIVNERKMVERLDL